MNQNQDTKPKTPFASGTITCLLLWIKDLDHEGQQVVKLQAASLLTEISWEPDKEMMGVHSASGIHP